MIGLVFVDTNVFVYLHDDSFARRTTSPPCQSRWSLTGELV